MNIPQERLRRSAKVLQFSYREDVGARVISGPNKLAEELIPAVPTMHEKLKIALTRATVRYGWNRRIFNRADFDAICRREGIKVEYHHEDSIEKMPHGLYVHVSGQAQIHFYPPYLPDRRYVTWVQMHELGHHFCRHWPTPIGYKAGKPEFAHLEHEADLFAACALIPRFLLDRHSIDEIPYLYPVASELCVSRALIESELEI